MVQYELNDTFWGFTFELFLKTLRRLAQIMENRFIITLKIWRGGIEASGTPIYQQITAGPLRRRARVLFYAHFRNNITIILQIKYRCNLTYTHTRIGLQV